MFGVFDPKHFEDFNTFKQVWNSLAKKNGLIGFEFFAYSSTREKLEIAKSKEYDCFVYEAMMDAIKHKDHKRFSIGWLKDYVKVRLHKPLMMTSYAKYAKEAIQRFQELDEVIPCIDPMFDHSPRSKGLGQILDKNDPKLWGELCNDVSKLVESNPMNPDKFVFIKAWNEWGEGNYMEPDARFGKAYIEEAGKAFK